jgi:hypothetical protein
VAGSGSSADEVAFGRHHRRPQPAGLRSWRSCMLLALLAIAASTATGLIVASSNSSQPPARPAGTISVINENMLDLQLKEATGARLAIRYLQPGQGPDTIWLDLVATGLPKGIDYSVTAGECLKGRPTAVAVASSGTPDPATGILILPLDNLRAAPAAVLWVRVSNVRGVRLGGIRGSFAPPGSTVAITPYEPACPQ